MPGFPSLLRRISDYYRTKREKVEETAEQFRDFYSRRVHLDLSAAGEIGQEGSGNDLAILKEAVGRLAASFDGIAGGFGGAPKFPHPMSLDFLLYQHLRRAARDAQITTSAATQQAKSARPRDSELGMVEFTLEKMANGGIYDQIGGGFHRYSVDDRWLVPHFEKMLYDNALAQPRLSARLSR